MKREKILEFLQDGVEKPIVVKNGKEVVSQKNQDKQKVESLMEDFDERNST